MNVDWEEKFVQIEDVSSRYLVAPSFDIVVVKRSFHVGVDVPFVEELGDEKRSEEMRGSLALPRDAQLFVAILKHGEEGTNDFVVEPFPR